MSLAQVHAAIAYYLHNRAEVDRYLAEQEIRRGKLANEIQQPATPDLREKPLARRGRPTDEWD